MLVTVLEARVSEDRWEALEAGYRRIAGELPPQLVATTLLQGEGDRTLWRLATTWTGRPGLEAYRASVGTPAGVALFEEVGAEPALGLFEVVAEVRNDGADVPTVSPEGEVD